jgi:lipopolysaccharide biosynthesis regulator YciM
MIELSAVAKAALGQLLSAVSTHVRGWFKKTPIERAAARVVGTHRHGEELTRALPAWFTSHQFATALFKIQQGGGETDQQGLATALIDAGFGVGDNTPRAALEIVEAFLGALEEELLRSSEGVLYSHQSHLQGLRRQHVDQRAGIEGVRLEMEKVSRGVAATHALLEDSRGATAERYFKGENPLPWQLPQDLRERLEAAERSLGAVIDRGRAEWPAVHKAARTIRGYLRAFLFRHGAACDDLSAVAAEGDAETNVLVNLSVFRIINDQPADALAAAEQAVRQSDDVQPRLILADAAGFAGDWDKSLMAAQEALRRAVGHDRERAYSAVTEALRRLKRLDEATSVLEIGLTETPGSDELLSMRALVLLDRGQVDQAITVSRDAIAQAPGGRRYLATIRGADLAFRARRYADAASLYRDVVNPAVVTVTLQRFTISLYETGAFDEALTIARSARKGRSPIATISEVEGAILERLGKLEEAAQLYEDMASAQVRPVRAMERLAIVYHRLGRADDMRRVVDRLIPRAEDDAHALMMVAHLLVAAGETG